MEITINKKDTQDINGDGSDVITTYSVLENGTEFRITCRSNRYGRTLGVAGKEGLLYINRDDNMVYWQVVALGGGCGLLIDDEPVEGLSPLAMRAIILAEESRETQEITITNQYSKDSPGQPLILMNDTMEDLSQRK